MWAIIQSSTSVFIETKTLVAEWLFAFKARSAQLLRSFTDGSFVLRGESVHCLIPHNSVRVVPIHGPVRRRISSRLRLLFPNGLHSDATSSKMLTASLTQEPVLETPSLTFNC